MTKAMGLFLCAGLLAALPARAHEGKRVDRCGCHHQFGLRHCHPNRTTPYCEAPASAKAPAKPAPAPAPGKNRL